MFTMLSYVQEEKEICTKIIENRKTILKDFINKQESQNPKKWIILATGSSLNASTSAKMYIEQISNIEVELRIPTQFTFYDKLWDKDSFIFGVSQSGHSFSTIEAIKKAKKENHKDVFTLTADLNSPIVKENSLIIPIDCGEETVPFVTKGFSTTVLTFMLMGLEAALINKSISQSIYEDEIIKLQNLVNTFPKMIESTTSWYQENKKEFLEMKRAVFIAYGALVGTTMEAETKVCETVRIPVNGCELEEYMHGPYLEINENHFLFFIGSHSNRLERLYALKGVMDKYTSHTFYIGHEKTNDSKNLWIEDDVDENLSPLLYVVTIQVLSYYLSKDTGIDLTQKRIPEFDLILKSKVD